MSNAISIRCTQLLHNQLKHFHVIVLFISYHINAFINFKFLVFQLSKPKVLGYVYRCAIFAKHKFFIKTFGC